VILPAFWVLKSLTIAFRVSASDPVKAFQNVIVTAPELAGGWVAAGGCVADGGWVETTAGWVAVAGAQALSTIAKTISMINTENNFFILFLLELGKMGRSFVDKRSYFSAQQPLLGLSTHFRDNSTG
jgi:hypothetical protein